MTRLRSLRAEVDPDVGSAAGGWTDWGLEEGERWFCRKELRPQIPGRGFGAQVAPYAVTPLPQVAPPARPTCRPGYQGPQSPPHGFATSDTPAHPARESASPGRKPRPPRGTTGKALNDSRLPLGPLEDVPPTH